MRHIRKEKAMWEGGCGTYGDIMHCLYDTFYYVLFESTVVLAKQKDYETLLSQPKLAQKRESAAAGTPVDSPAPSSDPKLAQARLHERMVTSKTL